MESFPILEANVRGGSNTVPMRGLACFLALLVPVAAAGCRRAEPPRVVVWIEVDTLRADALGCYGNRGTGVRGIEPSPALDALARESVLFERAYTAAPWTVPSATTQWSGEWPWEHGVQQLMELAPGEKLPLVPAIRDAGWRTAGVMTNFVLPGRLGFARGFEAWDDSLATGHEGLSGLAAIDSLLASADELAAQPGKGLFLLGWLFDPHYRYEDHPEFRFEQGYAGPLKGGEELNELLVRREQLTAEDARFLRARYQGEVRYTDEAIARLVAGLKQRGWYDQAAIIIVADHGEEILDRGWIGHSIHLHEELVRVPLIVKLPGNQRAGTRISDAVSLIDLPATVWELLGGSAERRFGHSRSLVSTLRDGARPERRWLYLHTEFTPIQDSALSDAKRGKQWGVIDAETNRKWIVDHKSDPPRAMLFDLNKDPGERFNLYPGSAGLEAKMRRLRAHVPESLKGEPPAPAGLLPEESWIAPLKDRQGLGPAFGEQP